MRRAASQAAKAPSHAVTFMKEEGTPRLLLWPAAMALLATLGQAVHVTWFGAWLAEVRGGCLVGLRFWSAAAPSVAVSSNEPGVASKHGSFEALIALPM